MNECEIFTAFVFTYFLRPKAVNRKEGLSPWSWLRPLDDFSYGLWKISQQENQTKKCLALGNQMIKINLGHGMGLICPNSISNTILLGPRSMLCVAEFLRRSSLESLTEFLLASLEFAVDRWQNPPLALSGRK
jgi:hypothetical protein